MITRLDVENFKSIHKESIDLGRINVFIGENGCGKTNILEALGMISAAEYGEIKNSYLALKGIRVTKPKITLNSFLEKKTNDTVKLRIKYSKGFVTILLKAKTPTNIDSAWEIDFLLPNTKGDPSLKSIEISLKSIEKETQRSNKELKSLLKRINKISNSSPENKQVQVMLKSILTKMEELQQKNKVGAEIYQSTSNAFKKNISNLDILLKDYFIYNLNTQILRGINPVSREIPGIQGENLDLLINSFNKQELSELIEYSYFISWLDDIIIDKEDKLKLDGHKLDLSTSILYFKDKFMQKSNNIFSAENANEGILHILFYLAIFISKKTPKIFAIDNIETALNPRLCRHLMEAIIKLAKKNEKQVLITTHNPAILDGLNLHDDEQRLFAVSRNKQGHTKVKRLQLKPDVKLNGKQLKLSELWMRGHLGAIPQHF